MYLTSCRSFGLDGIQITARNPSVTCARDLCCSSTACAILATPTHDAVLYHSAGTGRVFGWPLLGARQRLHFG